MHCLFNISVKIIFLKKVYSLNYMGENRKCLFYLSFLYFHKLHCLSEIHVER